MLRNFTKEILDFQSCPYKETSENKICETGYKKGIRPVILKNIRLDHLTTIRISFSFFDNSFTVQLCELLKKNETVSYLALESNNNLGDFGAFHLGNMLLENKCLRTLGIGGNGITDLGMKSIVNSLYTNNTLTQLITVNNNFTMRTVRKFLAVLKVNKSLHKVLLGTPKGTSFPLGYFEKTLQQQIQDLLLDTLSINFKICYFDLVKLLSNTFTTEKIILRLNQNNNLHYCYPHRFLMTPEELIVRVLVPLKNYQLTRIPIELRKNIFSFLGVSFKEDVQQWKQGILSSEDFITS